MDGSCLDPQSTELGGSPPLPPANVRLQGDDIVKTPLNYTESALIISQPAGPARHSPETCPAAARLESYILDPRDSSAELAWNELCSTFDTGASFGFEYPTFLWSLEEPSQTRAVQPDQNVIEGPNVSEERDYERPQSATDTTADDDAGQVNTESPYANDPLVYQFKRGRPIDPGKVCAFLHPQPAWKHLAALRNRLSGIAHVPQWGACDVIRDSVFARVFGMLSKRIDQGPHHHKIPHSFPPLATIDTFFEACSRGISALYPIIHTLTFSENAWSRQEPHNDTGILFTAIVALGCLGLPFHEPRAFSIELAYLIRLTINDEVERDECSLADKWVLSAWILMTIFSAWAGVKRHSEVAEAFHGVFSTVCQLELLQYLFLFFRYVGTNDLWFSKVFLRRNSYAASMVLAPDTGEAPSISWTAWIDHERSNR